MFNWIAESTELTSAGLTVRAQAIDPTDDGRLRYAEFFPRRDVDSVRLSDITTTEFRPAADRREWNQRGRLIPLVPPTLRDIEMVPIEAYFTVEEREIQALEERTAGNQALFRQLVGADIPTRTDGLVTADYRRLELDAFRAWSRGEIVAMNPQHGTTQTVSFKNQFAAERYQTAGAAWTMATAREEFIAWLIDMVGLVGPIEGVALRSPVLQLLRGAGDDRLKLVELEDEVASEIGNAFRFVQIEHTVERFTGAGLARVREKVWPAGHIAAIPQGGTIGSTAFAPVARAFEISRQTPEAGIDVRGVTVYHETANAGRELTVEAQLNALALPDEANTAVLDTGVS